MSSNLQRKETAGYVTPIQIGARLVLYHLEEGMDVKLDCSRVIRAGWRATGIIPSNVELVLGSSQVNTQPISLLAQELATRLLDATYRTSTRAQDLYRA